MTETNKKKKEIIKDPKRVLIFSSSLRLIAIVTSVREAAALLSGGYEKSCSPQNVSNAARGTQMTAKGYHIRFEHPDVEIEYPKDIGDLKLTDYDEMCGVERYIPSSIFLTRKRTARFKNKGYKWI